MTSQEFAELFAGVAGILVSLIAELIPAFHKLSDGAKRGVMAGAILLIGAATYGLSCAGWLTRLFDLVLTCDEAGLAVVLRALLFALFGNQGFYSLFFKKNKPPQVITYTSGG